jgi:hypothetical protein
MRPVQVSEIGCAVDVQVVAVHAVPTHRFIVQALNNFLPLCAAIQAVVETPGPALPPSSTAAPLPVHKLKMGLRYWINDSNKVVRSGQTDHHTLLVENEIWRHPLLSLVQF